MILFSLSTRREHRRQRRAHVLNGEFFSSLAMAMMILSISESVTFIDDPHSQHASPTEPFYCLISSFLETIKADLSCFRFFFLVPGLVVAFDTSNAFDTTDGPAQTLGWTLYQNMIPAGWLR